MSITFFTAPFCSATPVAVLLDELSLPHETVVLDLKKGESRQPQVLALNPNGKVPTLVVDGTPLFEGLAIAHYLGDRHGVSRGLWPAAEAPARLEAISWTAWAYVSYGAVIRLLGALPADGEARAAAQRESTQLLDVLDARLVKAPWILGGSFSLADSVLANTVKYGSFSGVGYAGHPHVAEWMGRNEARPAFQRGWAG